MQNTLNLPLLLLFTPSKLFSPEQRPLFCLTLIASLQGRTEERKQIKQNFDPGVSASKLQSYVTWNDDIVCNYHNISFDYACVLVYQRVPPALALFCTEISI